MSCKLEPQPVGSLGPRNLEGHSPGFIPSGHTQHRQDVVQSFPGRNPWTHPPFLSSLNTTAHVSLLTFAQAAPPPVLGLDNSYSCLTTN